MLRTVTDRLQSYQRMLQQLKMSAEQHVETTPVIKWAQSSKQIFISFKLSHRQDSPTCSDVRKQFFKTEQIAEANGDIEFEIVNNGSSDISSFNYHGECYFTTQKFWFRLAIKFQKKLSKLVLRKEGLGLYTIIGDKENLQIWVNPFTDFRKGAIWTEMRNKYEGDMNVFFEKMSNEGETVTRRRRKRRPKKEESANGGEL